MRIGFVTQWFPPESPSLAASTIANALASRGHEVHVVTGFPNYPTGKLYPGYKIRPYLHEPLGNFSVHRGPLYPSHDNSAARRIVNYISFSAGAVGTSFRFSEPDVWLSNSTPITTTLPGMVHRAFRRTPHAQIVQDLWPDSLTGSGFVNSRAGSLISAAIDPFCRASYALSDSIGVISPGMADVLASRSVSRSKISYVPNGIDDSHLHPSLGATSGLKAALGLPNRRLFMYAGNFGRLQNLENLVRAFVSFPEADLVLVGSGVEEEKLRYLAREASNVHFVERQPLASIGRFLAAADVQIVSLNDTPLLGVTMPSKVQASLASGRPILAHASGDAASVVTSANVGLQASPSNVDAAGDAIRKFMTLADGELVGMGLRARALYEKEYSLDAAAVRLEELLFSAIRNKKEVNS